MLWIRERKGMKLVLYTLLCATKWSAGPLSHGSSEAEAHDLASLLATVS